MEDVAECAVVHSLSIFLGFLDVCNVVIVEHQRTAHVAVDGGGRHAGHAMQDFHHLRVFVHRGCRTEQLLLSGLQARFPDVIVALHQQLQHEAAHLSRVAAVGGIVIHQGDVVAALQQVVEIIGIDGHLVVDGGQTVGFSDRVGDKRRVVDTLGHVALVAR